MDEQIILEAAQIIIEGKRWRWASLLKQIASGSISFSDIVNDRVKGFSQNLVDEFKRTFIQFMKEEGRSRIRIKEPPNKNLIFSIDSVLSGIYPTREEQFADYLRGWFSLFAEEELYDY